MITSEELKNELDILKQNKRVCVQNDKILEVQMIMVSSLVKEDNRNDRLLRLQTYVNDRYFLNQEMIQVLDFAMDYLKQTREVDSVYSCYLDKYTQLGKRIIKISKDGDFKDLFNQYIPSIDKGVNQSI